MEIKTNQPLTPDKIVYLIEQIRFEISNLKNALKNKNVNDPSYIYLQNQLVRLQNVLNKVLSKKGIMTPSETSDALEEINTSKKARLEGQYKRGITRGTVFLIAVGVVAVGVYLLIRKGKQ